jgi:demethylmenaquinone methyltransferase/2-methoxy-6-polyprenyl-1,4-benzoquinol methylase
MIQKNTPSSIIEDMKQYYEARAVEYDEWFYRRGRYNHGFESNSRWKRDVAVVEQALADFAMDGDILELAPGTGIWTSQLVKTASTITAVDASPEMIRMNQLNVASDKVDYIRGDLFNWRPSMEYDGIFFGFWISHVPLDRLDGFLAMVSAALKSGGKVFFVDSRPDQTMSATNHKLPEPGSQVMKRILNDGRSFDVIKNFFKPEELENHCAQAGLKVKVQETENYFFYGMGTKP